MPKKGETEQESLSKQTLVGSGFEPEEARFVIAGALEIKIFAKTFAHARISANICANKSENSVGNQIRT